MDIAEKCAAYSSAAHWQQVNSQGSGAYEPTTLVEATTALNVIVTAESNTHAAPAVPAPAAGRVGHRSTASADSSLPPIHCDALTNTLHAKHMQQHLTPHWHNGKIKHRPPW